MVKDNCESSTFYSQTKEISLVLDALESVVDHLLRWTKNVSLVHLA
jgi:hypothetical protein